MLAKYIYQILIAPVYEVLISQIENIINKEFKLSLKMFTGEITQDKIDLLLGICMT